MNDKLIEIAKANGAKDTLSGKVLMTPDQLRATIEQVCAPLVAALEYAEHTGDLLDVYGDVESAINGYRTLRRAQDCRARRTYQRA